MRIFLSPLIVLLVLPLSLGAQGNAPESAKSDARFAPMAFLVGSCWVGTFPDGKQTDEHCFEWAYDGKFIRDRHVVRGGPPYSGETFYAWDAANKHVGYWYFSSMGTVQEGYVEETKEGLVFPSATPGAEGEVRSVWTRLGSDGYRVNATQRKGGAWKTLFAMEMKRKM
jgi:hypothetical protein